MNKYFSLIIAIIITSFTLGGCFYDTRRPIMYLIPNNFVGWVRITYGKAGAPKLPIKGGYYVITFSADGLAETSTSLQSGIAKDKYYYVNGNQYRLLDSWSGWDSDMMIWGDTIGWREDEAVDNGVAKRVKSPLTERFFVGSEQQYEKLSVAPPVPPPIYGDTQQEKR